MFEQKFKGLNYSYSIDAQSGCHLLYNNERTNYYPLMGKDAVEFAKRILTMKKEPQCRAKPFIEMLIALYLSE